MGVPDWANAQNILSVMNDEGETFTATENCYVCVHVDCSSTGALRWKVNNIFTFGGYFVANEEHSYIVPLAKGDVVTTVGASARYAAMECYMVPFKG